MPKRKRSTRIPIAQPAPPTVLSSSAKIIPTPSSSDFANWSIALPPSVAIDRSLTAATAILDNDQLFCYAAELLRTLVDLLLLHTGDLIPCTPANQNNWTSVFPFAELCDAWDRVVAVWWAEDPLSTTEVDNLRIWVDSVVLGRYHKETHWLLSKGFEFLPVWDSWKVKRSMMLTSAVNNHPESSSDEWVDPDPIRAGIMAWLSSDMDCRVRKKDDSVSDEDRHECIRQFIETDHEAMLLAERTENCTDATTTDTVPLLVDAQKSSSTLEEARTGNGKILGPSPPPEIQKLHGAETTMKGILDALESQQADRMFRTHALSKSSFNRANTRLSVVQPTTFFELALHPSVLEGKDPKSHFIEEWSAVLPPFCRSWVRANPSVLPKPSFRIYSPLDVLGAEKATRTIEVRHGADANGHGNVKKRKLEEGKADPKGAEMVESIIIEIVRIEIKYDSSKRVRFFCWIR
ncbi:hypothetical protein BJ742DRAFT_363868 [Cladochytrium replicatum]|nr:hypothetical protein BJ742DRAFT_363868 [Cladochytrium replicatum]